MEFVCQQVPARVQGLQRFHDVSQNYFLNQFWYQLVGICRSRCEFMSNPIEKMWCIYKLSIIFFFVCCCFFLLCLFRFALSYWIKKKGKKCMKDVYSKPETLIFEVIQQEHCNYTQKYRVRQGPGYVHNYYTVRLILHFLFLSDHSSKTQPLLNRW